MNIIKIWFDELKMTMHDVGVLIFIVLLPLAYPLLYAYIYTNEVQRDVPVVALDKSNSSVSRQFLRNMDATPEVNVKYHATSMAEAYDLLARQEVYGIVEIPDEFHTNLFKGKQSVVAVYCDICSMLYYKNIALAASNVSIAMNKDIKTQNYIRSNTEREAQIAGAPISYDQTPLYNTAGGYASFMIPPILMLILQQALCLGIGMSMGRQREQNGGFAIPRNPIYSSGLEVVLGKLLFYLLLFIIMAIYAHVVVTELFGLPQLGHYGDFILFVIPYLMDCVLMGITVSDFIYRREDCMLLFVCMSLPLFFLSGLSWPGSAIPEGLKYVSYLFPSTFGLNAYVRISSMGASFNDVLPEMKAIWIQVAVYFFTAWFVYWRRVKQAKEGYNEYLERGKEV